VFAGCDTLIVPTRRTRRDMTRSIEPTLDRSPLRRTLERARRARSIAAFALFLFACSCSGGSERVHHPRNLLVIALDTLRADHLGCYGYTRPTSPFLDRFAQTSFVFENAQSQAAWTAPSLITLMTGLDTEVHQVCDSPNPGRLSANVTTLAELLKRAGFDTAAFTEGGYAKGQFGLDQGFDFYPPNPGDTESDHSINGQTSRLSGNIDRTLAWLGEHRAHPFFCFFHTYEIHAPYRAPEELIRAFRPGYDEKAEHAELARILATWNRDRTITREDCEFLAPRSQICRTRASWNDLPKIEHAEELARQANEFGVGPKNLVLRPELRDLARDVYDAGILSADRGIERLLAGIAALGLVDDTMIVVVSDHGEGLGEHGQIEHGYELHEEILHVVMMMRVPGKDFEPRRVPDLVRLVDVVPTVLDVLGVDAKRSVFQGQSLVPMMRGRPLELTAFSHGRTIDRKTDFLYSARDPHWRLNYDLSSQRAWLYDRTLDPGEEHDVAAAEPDVVARLRALILREHERDLALQRALASNVRLEALDAKTLKELRGLGYAGGDADKH
jgi:arylsulfatase A-like enzyme